MNLTDGLGVERIVMAPQGPIRVYQCGEGPPIVFIHGLFANAAARRRVVPLLADRYHCITADCPSGPTGRGCIPTPI